MNDLEKYKKYIREKINSLLPAVADAAIGNFSHKIDVPDKDDEFAELQTGIKLMQDEIESRIKAYEELQKHLEQKVKEKTNALEEAQALAHIGSWEWNVKNNTLFWSNELYRIYGLEPQSINLTFEKFISRIHPDDREMITTSVEEAFKDHKPFEFHHRILVDNDIKKLYGRGKVITDKHGDVVKMIGTGQDITGMRKTQELLQQKEELYRTVINSMGDGLMITDHEDRILFTNQELEDLTGYTQKEMVGKIAFKLFNLTRSDTDHIKKHLKDRQKGISASYILELKRKDGKYFKAQVNASPYRNSAGEIIGTVGVITDITDLLEAENRFRKLLESAPDAMVIVDDKGIIQLVNAQTQKIFGYKKEEMVGQKVELLMPSRFTDNHYKHRRNFFANPKVRGMGTGMELFAKKKDGKEFPVEISLSPLKTEGGLLVSAAIRDITDRKILENKLRNINAELDYKVRERTVDLEKKNKELEIFAYVASHDLKEPLRGILIIADLLNEDYKEQLDPSAHEYLNLLKNRSMRMVERINALLEYTRIGRDQTFSKINSEELLNNITNDLDTLIKENNVKISNRNLPVVYGNHVEIRQLLHNLLTNAIKFRKKDIPSEVTISAKKEKDHWLFTVKDNGIGIKPQYKDRIFILFQRLHDVKEYAGTGIGLTICKKIIEAHKGEIWVESEPGRGSAFYFTIPADEKSV